MPIPIDLATSLKKTAQTLEKTFHLVRSLNGPKNAPMPERNTVVHFGAALIEHGFAVYAEPSPVDSNNRIDLVASNGALSFAIEVKTFGDRDIGAVIKDTKRLTKYEPWSTDHPNPEAIGFWTGSERWGVVVIQAFVGDEFEAAWNSMLASSFLSKVARVSNVDAKRMLEFHNLSAWLKSQPNADVGSIRICKDLWTTTPLDILWAAFRLP